MKYLPSNKIGNSARGGNHNMLEGEKGRPHWQTLDYPHPLCTDTMQKDSNLCLDMLTCVDVNGAMTFQEKLLKIPRILFSSFYSKSPVLIFTQP